MISRSDISDAIRTPIAANRLDTCSATTKSRLQTAALRASEELTRTGSGKPSRLLQHKWKQASRAIQHVVQTFTNCSDDRWARLDWARWVAENERLLWSTLGETRESIKAARRLPQIQWRGGTVPSAYGAAEAFLEATEFSFEDEQLKTYFKALQKVSPFKLGELWALRPMLQLVLLERIAPFMSRLPTLDFTHASPASPFPRNLGPSLLSTLRNTGEADWNELVEELSVVHKVLCLDPQGAYLQMDFESRSCYRGIVQELASRSHSDEQTVARTALELTQTAARASPQLTCDRRSHIGYFLIDKGRMRLEQKVGYHPPWWTHLARFASRQPTPFYLAVVIFLTLLAMATVVTKLTSAAAVFEAGLLLLIPASECAMEIANQLFPFLFPPKLIPKLDFSSGIPRRCSTMVVVPTILHDAGQVRRLARELEVRYLGNRDPNLHFALVTDFPDSLNPIDDRHPLVSACSALVADLDSRYRRHRAGRFFHFHRRQVYDQQQGKWMGWERKRGKLLEFNELLRGRSSAFPIKVGDLSLLSQMKYVITLDADTRLPLNSARRLVAAMAHPLNHAVLDSTTNTVKEGYGIRQPRIGVSIHSASRSWLAKIFSGGTGFDIYTNAVSNVYQDLCGEGTFTGKGIYDVDVFQRTLAKTFPPDLILSHDLLEGAYARAGLVPDVELIDDYPSHFSAFAKRKHRWVRGDWQVMFWMLPWVPGHCGGWVPNPIAPISRWKVLDNLRRSLLEIAMVILLLAGWLFLPGGAVYWTSAAIALFLLPIFVRFLLSLLIKRPPGNPIDSFKEPCREFLPDILQAFVLLALLASQALIAADAIVRTVWRMAVTHRNLLEWETSAQCDSETQRTGLPHRALMYSSIASCMLVGLLIFLRQRASIAALPLLLLWICAGLLCDWLDQPIPNTHSRIRLTGQHLLREIALRTWIFFRTFSNRQTHWLIPDNVWEDPEACSSRTSPTNIGLLLNSRIAAHELGYITVEEFSSQIEMTLTTLTQLPQYCGHFFNWYDIRTLQPEEPLFISTVDSGNLAASLLTLKQFCLAIGQQPVPRTRLWEGLKDHVGLVLALSRSVEPSKVSAEVQVLAALLDRPGNAEWSQYLPALAGTLTKLSLQQIDDQHIATRELRWAIAETLSRVTALREHSLYETGFTVQVRTGIPEGNPRTAEDTILNRRLLSIVKQVDWLVSQMDYSFLYRRRKGALSVGYDCGRRTLHESCYDLLASEARTALFIAIAKGELPSESWFNLGRAHTRFQNRNVLLSWSGTMFEYMMPNLWMKLFPGTLLEKTVRAAVRSQTKLSKSMQKPWGLSEAACSQRTRDGAYEYLAFGLPELSLRIFVPRRVAISPYSSFLALLVDSRSALDNIRSMKNLNWLGKFGFYEAMVLGQSESHLEGQGELIRCWMAHHQGMTLLAICNLLSSFRIQDMFHSEPMIAAAERLLEENFPTNTRVHQRKPQRPSIVRRAGAWISACHALVAKFHENRRE